MFFEAKENPGRRPFPRDERHFEMVTMGHAIIVSATDDIMPYLKEQLSDKSRDEAIFTSHNAVSFKSYIGKYNPKTAVRFSTNEYLVNGAITDIPLYFAGKIFELTGWA